MSGGPGNGFGPEPRSRTPERTRQSVSERHNVRDALFYPAGSSTEKPRLFMSNPDS